MREIKTTITKSLSIMHYTAMEYGKAFFNSYSIKKGLIIVEIGSQDVNGSLRNVAPDGSNYKGLDFVEGKGVDLVLQDPYKLPFPDNYADIVVSSSCFEHTEFFWISFLEQLRILKSSGVLYINAPSNGNYHTYPVDNWRFYPDSSKALSNYANMMGYKTVVLESFTGKQYGEGGWNDYVAVFLKDKSYINEYKKNIYQNVDDFLKPTNIWVYGNNQIINKQEESEDSIKISISSNQIKELNLMLENANKNLFNYSICTSLLVIIVIIILIKIFRKNQNPSIII